MTKLTPFADDATSIGIGELTIENGTDEIKLYGSLDITCDKQGLAKARSLKALLDQAVQAMEAQTDLPDALPPAAKPKKVTNPFG